MRSVADVIVVGAGPAGSAAAIQSALAGRSVTLIEHQAFPRHRPGETLHPGVRAIFDQLGVSAEVDAVAEMRHTAIDLAWGRRQGRVAYSPQGQGSWFGYQIDRARLDAILLARARALGVTVLQPYRATGVEFSDGGVTVTTRRGAIAGRVLIDATGAAAWLVRKLDLTLECWSPPLRTRYGYCAAAGSMGDTAPRLIGTVDGWSWIAPLSDRRTAWVQTAWNGSTPQKPPLLEGACDLAPPKGADVTWRRPTVAAGPGFFLCGDAAGLLDPCSSHGVLRALMSGMMAAYQTRQGSDPSVSATRFQAWMNDWWAADVVRLRRFYSELDPAWATPAARTSAAHRH